MSNVDRFLLYECTIIRIRRTRILFVFRVRFDEKCKYHIMTYINYKSNLPVIFTNIIISNNNNRDYI